MIYEIDRRPADFHGLEKTIIENKSFPGRVFLDVAVEGFPNDRSRQGRFDFDRIPLVDDEIDLGFGFRPPVFHFSVRL